MGLLDFASKVLTEYKADISDHRAKVKELTGEQKKLAQAELEAAKASNEHLDGQIDKLGKAALAVGAFYAAYKVAQASVNETIEFQKQQAASAEFNIEKLQAAAGGLIDDMEAMKFAATTSAGAFKLNQNQMELFQQVIRAYTKDGFDAKEVTDRFTEALVSGKTRGLREFGIQLDDTRDKTKLLNELMAVGQKEIDKYGGNLEVAGDSWRRSSVAWSDALDDIKHRIGELVIKLAPLVELLAKAVSLISAVIPGDLQDTPLGEAMRSGQNDQNGLRNLTFGEGYSKGLTPGIARQLGKGLDEQKTVYYIAGDEIARQIKDWVRKNVKNEYRQPEYHNDGFESESIGTMKNINGGLFDGLDSGAIHRGIAQLIGQAEDVQSGFGNLWRTSVEGGSRSDRYQQFVAGRAQTWSERTFGPIDQFDKYATGFGILKDAGMAAFQAWETGSESLGTAIKKALANSLAATASSMFAHGLEEGAYALASLAFGDAKGATQHGIAAGAFLGGAIVVGGIAKEMGAGASTGSGANAGAASGGGRAPSVIGSTGSGADTAPRNITVIVPDNGDTVHQRQQRAFNALQQAKRIGGDGSGVVWG
jgi:hypothetical protein